MELSIAFKLLIAMVLGAVIGIEREIHEKHDKSDESVNIAYMGVRSLSLITALGAVAGLLHGSYFSLFMLINVSFMVLLMLHYIFTCITTKDIGITTELAVIFSYLIGLFIALETFPIQLTLAMTVVLVLLLSQKDTIKNFTDDIQKRELRAFVAYALVALVILPFLPNKDYTLASIPNLESVLNTFGQDLGRWEKVQIINPFKLWMIVALITGIDIAGYILEKTVGKNRGLLLASLVGGVISSTATTQSLAQQSKVSTNINKLVGAAILATTISFIPTLLLIIPINAEFVIRVLPTFLILFVSSLVTGIFFLLRKEGKGKKKKNNEATESTSTIFALVPALKFALLYMVIRIASKVALELFGESGFLVTTAIAGLTGIDAATINIADLAGGNLKYQTAVLAFIILNAVNLGAKTFYSHLQGKREFVVKYGISMAIVIASSLLGLLLV